jgi:class 3 adenylate cyclase
MTEDGRQGAQAITHTPHRRLRWPFRWRIAPTLALIFTGTVTVATLINGIVVTTSSLGVAQQATAMRLREATRALAAELDADDLATLRDPSKQSDPIYLRSHAQLAQALDHIEGVRFIYTLRKVSGKPKDAFSRYAFVVDGTPYGSKDFEKIGAVMTTSPSTDALHRIWQTGRFEVDRSFVTDQWGTWLSGYYPLFRRDGSFEAVLGIDISAQSVVDERERILHTLSQGYLLSLLVLLPAAAIFGRRISGPLRRINDRLLAISRLELNPAKPPPPLKCQWVHEIHEISNSLTRVESALVDFNRYVPASLVRKLVVKESAIPLNGEVRDLAIMFTDIIGFTGLTEKLSPEAILHALNEYFTIIHESAEHTHGILDKYMGDAALLFWGAPDAIEQPARAAVEAALLCYQGIEALNERWNQQGSSLRFSTCFGLDYGSVVVGNIGSTTRVNYTIVGDRVNLCNRVETVNRRYGTHILATRCLITALGAAAEEYLIIKIDDARLRGISEPVELFEIRCRRSDASPADLRFEASFAAAFEAAAKGRIAAAITSIEALPEPYRSLRYVQMALHRLHDPHMDPNHPEVVAGFSSRRDANP